MNQLSTPLALTILLAMCIHHVQSECIPWSRSFLPRSLLPLFPSYYSYSTHPEPRPPVPAPAMAPSEEQSPSPSPAPIEAKPNVMSMSATSSEATNICGKTDYPDICSPILRLFAPSKLANPTLMLESTIQVMLNETTAAMAEMKNQRDGAMSDCKENYDSAFSNLKEADAAIKAGDIGTIETMLSAAMTDYSTCEQGFSEMGSDSPLAAAGDKLMKMSSNSLALASLIR